MTSINTDDYKQVLLRLDSTDKDQVNKNQPNKLGSFNAVLSNVENDRNQALEGEKRKLTISNEVEEDFNKTESIHKIVAPPPLVENLSLIGDFPIDEVDSKAIEESKVEVIDNLPPEIPKIVSSRMGPPIEISENEIKLEIEDNIIHEKHENIKNIIITAGKYHGVDPSIGLAIAKVESEFNPNAVSRDGFSSKGIFQLLDSTGKEVHSNSGMTEPYKPFDPSMNTFLGMGHFRKLLDIFSKETPLTSSMSTYPAISADELEKFAIAAYNAGEGNVARAQQKAFKEGKDPSKFSDIRPYLPEITKGYVDKVNDLRNKIALNLQESKIV